MATLFKSAIVESKITANVELMGNHVDGRRVKLNNFNEVIKLCSGSDPDGAYVFAGELTMTGSAQTIDLYDSLVDVEGNTVTMTGQRLRAVKFKAPSTNLGLVYMINHPTNGYLIFPTVWTWQIGAGQSILCFLDSIAPVVDSSHCNIQVTGTENDKLEYIMVFG